MAAAFAELINFETADLHRWLQRKLIDFARPRPLVRTLRQSRPNRILSHIIPFLIVTFIGTQEVIEKLTLPDRCCSRGRCPRQFGDSATTPALPRSDKNRQGIGLWLRGTKQVNMVGHDDVPSNTPAISFT